MNNSTRVGRVYKAPAYDVVHFKVIYREFCTKHSREAKCRCMDRPNSTRGSSALSDYYALAEVYYSAWKF